MKMLSIAEIKRQASLLKDFLSQTNAAISQSSCLQAVAKMHGFKDWNTLSANLKKLPMTAVKKKFWGSKSIEISEAACVSMSNYGHDGKFGGDAYHLLNVILLKIKENSLVVKGITNRSLWERWTQSRFDSALQQLLAVKFIHCTYDNNEKLIITINPLYFWRGDEEGYVEATQLFDVAIASTGGYLPPIEFPQDSGKFDFQIKEANRDNVDISSVIALAEERNQNNYYPRKVPTLRVCDSVVLADHPKLENLQRYIAQQKPISDPLIHLIKVHDTLDGEYYVGYGGTHIHIKTPDEKTEIAFITAGI